MVIEFIISAIVLGFVVAIPPGSVTVIACQRAILFGFRNSLYFSLGSGVSDVFYILLVYLGVANVFATNTSLKITLWIVCGVILIFVGAGSIISAMRAKEDESQLQTFNTGFTATFISGILITLTNPMTIVGWLAIAGNFFLIWNGKLPESKQYLSLTIILIMFGAYLWFIPLIYIVSKLRKVMSSRVKKLLILVTSGCLVFFGLSAFCFAYINIR